MCEYYGTLCRLKLISSFGKVSLIPLKMKISMHMAFHGYGAMFCANFGYPSLAVARHTYALSCNNSSFAGEMVMEFTGRVMPGDHVNTDPRRLDYAMELYDGINVHEGHTEPDYICMHNALKENTKHFENIEKVSAKKF